MQTLREKARGLKEQFQELTKMVSKSDKESGRDSKITNPPQCISSLNWNKGWGKYGKT